MKNQKKRTYRRRPSFRKQLAKNSETKCIYTPISISTNISTDGGVDDLVEIAQGSGPNQRIGSTLQLRHLKISAQIQPGTTTTPIYPVRVMLFYSSTQAGASLSLQDYLTGSYDPKQWFPLYDRYHTFKTFFDGTNVVEQGPIVLNISKKINYYQKYSGVNGSDLQKGHLIMVINQQNEASVRYTLNGRMECWYDDM